MHGRYGQDLIRQLLPGGPLPNLLHVNVVGGTGTVRDECHHLERNAPRSIFAMLTI